MRTAASGAAAILLQMHEDDVVVVDRRGRDGCGRVTLREAEGPLQAAAIKATKVGTAFYALGSGIVIH